MEGTCSPEEEQLLWQWFFLLDTRSQEMIRQQVPESVIGSAMRRVIMTHVNKPKKVFILFRRPMIAAAAVVAILLTTALLWFLSGSSKRQDTLAGAIYAGNDHIRSFYLPDSTKVVLNLGSGLSWTPDFGRQDRRVVLKGEGYFEVYPDKDHPFIVESNGLETRALGTAFNIEAYQGETEMRVSLLHGKVAITDVQKTLPPAILQTGQLLRYRYAQKDRQVENISVGNSLAWTAGGMTFNRIPLSEALDRLARRYRIHIRYDPQRLKDKTVSGSFHATSWEKLLPNILFVHDLQYSVRDSTISIHE